MHGPMPPASTGTQMDESSAQLPPASVVQARFDGFHETGGGAPSVATAQAPPNAPTGSARQNAGKSTPGMLSPQLVLCPFIGPSAPHSFCVDAHRRCVVQS